MKHIFLILTTLLLAGNIWAKPVDAATAHRVASTWLQAMGNPAPLSDVTAATPFTEFYVFTAAGGGFVLVSADDCVVPILGYSAGNRFDTGEIPEHVRLWLVDYEKEIRHWRALEASGEWQTPDEVSLQWARLAAGSMPPMPKSKSMNDTITSRWGQGQYYNLLCPADSNHSSGHALTGCVATSMAMVMKHWNFPASGHASHGYNHSDDDASYGWQYADFGAATYQWNLMPARLTAVTSLAQDSAVALLMYHSGVSVNMDYGTSGSGAQTVNSGNFTKASQEHALVNYFKYSPALHSVYYGDFTPAGWNALMASEIDAGRPVIYAGSGSGGHAFVLDGYNADGNFHFNWGWSGSYNGYFPIGGLTPASNHNYNKSNKANIGIQPNLDWGSGGTVTVLANDSTRGTVSPSVTYSFGDTVRISAQPNHGYRFSRWSDGSPFISRTLYGTGGDYTFTAIFEPVGIDTLILYGGGNKMTSYGWPSHGEYSWGVKFDSSYLHVGRELHAVEFYVGQAGSYDLTVYLGTSSPSTAVYDTTFTADSAELDQWKTVGLDIPVVVDGWQSIWVIFHRVTTGYPACVTTYGGIDEGFVSVSGSSFNNVGAQRGYSSMIRGLFRETATRPAPFVYARGSQQIPVGGTATFSATCTPGETVVWTLPGASPSSATGPEINAVYNTPGTYLAIATVTNTAGSASDTVALLVLDYTQGDTVSYCLDRPAIQNSFGNSDSTTWGIMLPSPFLRGRNHLTGVLVFVARGGDYTLRIHQGGSTAPGTLVYSNTFNLSLPEAGYALCTPESPIPIDTTRNLWIVFSSATPYPITYCDYMGDPNSNWILQAGRWEQLSVQHPDQPYSWLIKAVTADALECIDHAESDRILITVSHGRIAVHGADGETVRLFDIAGRPVANRNLPAGVYLVAVGDRPARKVLVVD